MPPAFWWRAWKRVSWLRALCGRISKPSRAARGVASWIASQRDSRALRSAWQGSGREYGTNDGSGRTSPASLPPSFPVMCFSRMCPACSPRLLVAPSVTCSGPWPRSGTMRAGRIAERSMSVPRIVASGSSSSPHWQTATATDAKGRGWATSLARDWMGVSNNSSDLPRQVMAWATPTSHARTHTPRQVDHGIQLANQAAMWPTPSATPDGTNQSGGMSRVGPIRPSLETMARFGDGLVFLPAPTTPAAGGDGSPPDGPRQLSPAFVEALMGFPAGWTLPLGGSIDSAASATPSSRSRRRSRGASCGGGFTTPKET